MPKSKVSLVKKDNLKASLETAVNMISGFDDLKDKRVLLKPNMNSNDPFPATSNPQLVRLLINLIKEKQPAEIILADAANASYLPTVESMKQTGLYDAVADLGIQVIGLEEYGWKEARITQASNWKQMKVSAVLDEVNFFISQCNVKTHFLANYSMALKNMMGLVSHRSRMAMHLSARPKFWAMIAEISLYRKPDLIILDGTKAMVTGGPFSGEVRQTGILAASNDMVAIDAIGLALLKTLGTTPQVADVSVWEQPVLSRAVELGLGVSSKEEIELLAEGIEEIEQIKFNLAKPAEKKAA